MPRPDKQESVVFDLVEDGGAGLGPDGGPGGSTGRPRARVLRLPRLSRRTWLVAASTLVGLVVMTVAVDLVRDHQRTELMRTSSLGVASLADPPEETWTVPFDHPADLGQGPFVDQQVVIMDRLLVLPPGGTQSYTVSPSTGAAEPEPVGFEDIVAVEPGTGEVAWRVPVGESPVCGPMGYDGSTSTDVLVCVHGPSDAREVLTVAPDGSTSSRAAGLADGEQIFPGPDGLAVRVERIGPAAEPVECSAMDTCTPPMLTSGRDAVVTAEDAETGVERWTSTIEFTPVESMSCQQFSASNQPLGVDADMVSLHIGVGMIDVDGCGIRATLSAQGVRLDLLGGGEGTSSWVTELGAGTFAVEEPGTGAVVVVDAAGAVLRTLDGFVTTGVSSPDAPDDLWFVSSRTGSSGFDAVREDGSVAWTDRTSQGVLLAGRDVVVMDAAGTIAGVDRTTGERLWDWSSGYPVGMAVLRALTDGAVVAIAVLPQEADDGGRLVALDLSSGEELWDTPIAGSTVAVDGHIVEITVDGLTGRG